MTCEVMLKLGREMLYSIGIKIFKIYIKKCKGRDYGEKTI